MQCIKSPRSITKPLSVIFAQPNSYQRFIGRRVRHQRLISDPAASELFGRGQEIRCRQVTGCDDQKDPQRRSRGPFSLHFTLPFSRRLCVRNALMMQYIDCRLQHWQRTCLPDVSESVIHYIPYTRPSPQSVRHRHRLAPFTLIFHPARSPTLCLFEE